MLSLLPNTLTPARTWSPANRLDAFFSPFHGEDGGVFGRALAGVPVAMWEDEDHVYVEAEMAGVREEDVDITVHDGRLFIRGERKPAEGRQYLYNGLAYGRFARVITLPDAVNTDNVEAKLADGMLSITLPKSPEAKPKKIQLKTS